MSIRKNQIRWVHELINPLDINAIGEEINAQHYISNIRDFSIGTGIIRFFVERHLDIDGEPYAYRVELDINQGNGQYENIESNFIGEIPSFEFFEHGTDILLVGQWNENSGRDSNVEITRPNDTRRSWPENWAWWAIIEKI